MRKPAGTVRCKLATMVVAELKTQGVEARCDPSRLIPAQGYWRQIQQDVMTWEGWCEVKLGDGRWTQRSLGSWDRMSSCIRGLSISRDGNGYEVHAKNEIEPADRYRTKFKLAH